MITKTTFVGNDISRTAGRREIRRILCFILIGSGSVAIDYSIFIWLTTYINANIAKGISYIAGMCFGYIGNKYWSFESSRKAISEPALYCIVYCLTLTINIASYMASQSALSRPGLSFVLATGLTTVLNYLGLRFLAFRQAINQQAKEKSTIS
jgi:putative flippase GtrA